MADIKVSALPAGNATPTGVLPVVNNGVTQKVTVKSIVDLATASMPSGTVDTTATGPITGITVSPNLSIQQWSEEMALKAAFKDTPVTFTRVDIAGPGDLGDFGGGAGWLSSTSAVFGTLLYGSGGPIRAGGAQGYELPTPTQQGYLRADLDPNSGWYFAEPVIVSDTEPPKPPGDPALPTLWIDPTGTAPPDPTTSFSNANPPVYADPAVTEQPNGLPIGLSADGLEIHQPYMVGGVPVLVGGKTYLLPLIEAPASALPMTPLFSFDDQPTTQQLDGTWIGLTPDGQFVYQPQMVGGIPVVVGGKTFLLPLVER
jgi:hypothetical protein